MAFDGDRFAPQKLETDPEQGLAQRKPKSALENTATTSSERKRKLLPSYFFINQFKNTLIIILIVATVLSALVGDLLDAGIIVVIVVFCAVLGFVQEYRAERALDALKKMLTPTITVLRGGKELEVLAKELVPGDILLLEAGDKIPRMAD